MNCKLMVSRHIQSQSTKTLVQILTGRHKEVLRKRYILEQQWERQSCRGNDGGGGKVESSSSSSSPIQQMKDQKQNSSKTHKPKEIAAPKQKKIARGNSDYSAETTSSSSSSRNIISVPSRNNVLLGRGKGYFTHVGNIRYRAMIQELMVQYDVASKEMKCQITKEVVDAVQKAGGRFLKDDGVGWIVVETETARLKVSHSFRSARKSAAATERGKANTAGNNVTSTKSNMHSRSAGSSPVKRIRRSG